MLLLLFPINKVAILQSQHSRQIMIINNVMDSKIDDNDTSIKIIKLNGISST